MTRRWIGVALLFAAGCSNELDLRPASSPTPVPVTTQPPGFPVDTGDGLDGLLDVASGAVFVNRCVRVASVSGAALTLDGDGGFSAGRRALLHRAQDALAQTAGPTGAVDPGGAGAWAVVRVLSSSVDAVVLEAAPAITSDAQLCTLPEYADVRIAAGGAITAPQWDGESGGVLAFLVSGTLMVDGALGADGAGFRPGVISSNGDYGGVTDFVTTTAGAAAFRGEGIDLAAYGTQGRGAWANAGGGGGSFNGAGGGGGSGGAGGQGDRGLNGTQSPPNNATAGLGGSAVDAGSVLLLFGGGGGGGHQDDGNAGAGGRGGGAVFVVVGALAGAGTLSSDGASGLDTVLLAGADSDAAGGGGAGGTITLWSATTTFSGFLRAAGGNGGNGPDANSHPGGGGGGGFVRATFAGGIAPGGLAGSDGGAAQAASGSPGIVAAP